MLIDVNTYEFNVIKMTYNRIYNIYCNLTDFITGANFRDSFFRRNYITSANVFKGNAKCFEIVFIACMDYYFLLRMSPDVVFVILDYDSSNTQ